MSPNGMSSSGTSSNGMASQPMSSHPTPEPLQLSLLQGFPATARTAGGPPLAAARPVARVLIESPLPHLDRPFDYSVPAELDDEAQPGVRVRVKFSGQELGGYILDRVEESDAGQPLVPLHKVVSPVAVLTTALQELAGRVAARYAGTVSDVLDGQDVFEGSLDAVQVAVVGNDDDGAASGCPDRRHSVRDEPRPAVRAKPLQGTEGSPW